MAIQRRNPDMADLLRPDFLSFAYVCVRDVKAQNTAGGAFNNGAWRTRDLTNEQADTANICTLFGNQITIVAGTYRCIISCPARYVDRHQTRLQNITDGATLLVGTCAHSPATGAWVTRSFVVGRFVLAAAKVLEVQHRCETTRAVDGFGRECNWTDEVYTVGEFWRIIA